jgi:hypothetical protein
MRLRIFRLIKLEQGSVTIQKMVLMAISFLVIVFANKIWDAIKGPVSARINEVAVVIAGGKANGGGGQSTPGNNGGTMPGTVPVTDPTTGNTGAPNPGGSGGALDPGNIGNPSNPPPIGGEPGGNGKNPGNAVEPNPGNNGPGSNLDPPKDDGFLDPVGDGFPNAVAEALAKRAVEKRMASLDALVAKSNEKLINAIGSSDKAAKALEEGLKNPDLSLLERLDLENKAANARVDSLNARIQYEDVLENRNSVGKVTQQFQRSVAIINANAGLIETDKLRRELINQGKYQEAWRESVKGALGAVTDVALTFTDKIPGGFLAEELINEGVDLAGERLADDSFPAMVDFSHWLYKQPWWPKNRVPRFPPGYDPKKDPTK